MKWRIFSWHTRKLLGKLHDNSNSQGHQQGARFEQLSHVHVRLRLLGCVFSKFKMQMVLTANKKKIKRTAHRVT